MTKCGETGNIQLSNLTLPLRKAAWSQRYTSNSTSNNLCTLPFKPWTKNPVTILRMKVVRLILLAQIHDPHHERKTPTCKLQAMC